MSEDRYEKQTLRNRCSIYGANGVIQLSIPVIRPHGKHTTMAQALISYAEPWQQIHWRSIKSAYGRTPYFEFFEHQLEPLFKENHTHLMDFLLVVNRRVFDIFKAELPVLSNRAVDVQIQTDLDARAAISSYQSSDNYYQIFEDRHGFQPNLSVLDWLFHCGNRL